ncbi:MAG: hypothetical protein WCF67_16200 [Chitinophagaceae bacterium]
MKFLAFMLLVISMAATFIPCCEFDGCADEPVAAAHQDNEDKKPGCSPLSTCNRCSVAAIVALKLPQLDTPSITKGQFIEARIASVSPSYFPSFWQPPRLS